MAQSAIEEYLKHIAHIPEHLRGDVCRDAERELYKNSLYLTAKYLLGYKEVNHQTHGEMIDVLENDSKRKLIIMPRGTFKTSLAVVAYPIWRLLNNPNERIIIDSELYNNAKRSLREIAQHLQSDCVVKLFGVFRGDGVWNESEIQINQRNVIKKEPSIMASGIGAEKTGVHAEVILGDDLCSPNNMNTAENRDKVYDHYRYFTSILEPGGTICLVGTRYSSDDLYARVLDREIFLSDEEWRYPTLVKDPNARMKKRIYHEARKFGLSHEDGLDLGQEYELRRLEGLSKNQSATHFVIDALRRQGFDTSLGYPSIHEARRELKIDPSFWTNPLKVNRLTEALRGYSLDERVALVLTYLWGFTPSEVGFVLGLMEWRVKEMLRELDKWVRPARGV